MKKLKTFFFTEEIQCIVQGGALFLIVVLFFLAMCTIVRWFT